LFSAVSTRDFAGEFDKLSEVQKAEIYKSIVTKSQEKKRRCECNG